MRELAPLFNLLLLAPLFVFIWVVFRTAWLCDDAYISFRSVENVILGHGPVWNPGERVQSFSHPLWFILITPLRAITGELYFTSIFFSILVSFLAVIVLAFAGRGGWMRRFLMVALCCFSGAFIDYSTSGLENPLSHLILALFFLALFRQQPGVPRSFFLLAFVAGLGVLNRLDTVLIYAPALLGELFVRYRSATAVLPANADSGFWHDRTPPSGGEVVFSFLGLSFLGFLPFLLWEIFSVLYYGFPFPNPAYAKLNTGIPRIELLSQGAAYFLHSLRHDPATIGVLLAGMTAGLLEPSGRVRGLAFGAVLYIAYVVWVGGDFMAGRFLSVPFFVAVLLLSEVGMPGFHTAVRWILGLMLAGLAGLSLLIAPARSPVLSGPDYPGRPEGAVQYDWKGIADERGAYYPWTGLLRENVNDRTPESHEWAEMGKAIGEIAPEVAVLPGIGLAGWRLGPEVYAVDLNGLTDPLLARLPAMREPSWRVGHYTRAVPPGYMASLVQDRVRIEDPEIAQYYEDLRLVTRGPLLKKARFDAILRMNLKPKPGHPDWNAYQFPSSEYRPPPRSHFEAPALTSPALPVTLPGGQSFALYRWKVSRARGVVFAPRPSTDYDVVFARGGIELGRFIVRRQPKESDGGPPDDARALIPVPPRIASEGWDNIAFYPREFAGPQLIRAIRPTGRSGN